MADPVTLINSFEVPGAEAEKFITAWQKARDYLQAQPGYVGQTDWPSKLLAGRTASAAVLLAQ